MSRINVLQVGLGAIGSQISKIILSKDRFHLIGAVDDDHEKKGKDLGLLLGLDKLKVSVSENFASILTTKKPQIAVVATTSSLEKIKPTLLELLTHKINIVSTCEELTFPWKTNPKIAKEIDDCAKEHGVSVLATGVNPGFLMDFFPMIMTGVCKEVEKIQVERIQDAQFRRRPFQTKIGMGLSREKFFEKVSNGALRHVGLVESMDLIASKLGWVLERTEDTIEPVLATKQVFSGDLFIGNGDILGVNQIGLGYVNNKEVIRLFFRATIGEPNPRDRILISGTPNMEVEIKGGLHGDLATCDLIVNAIPIVLNANPGLRTMADIEPISCLH